MSELYKQVNYITHEKSVGNTLIREYDIAKANINILLYKGLLTRERYEYLSNLPKKIREIKVGIMQKNKRFLKAIKEGIIEFKEKFFRYNSLKDTDIVAIKNDAIYVAGVVPEYTRFSNVEFKLKNVYTTFMNVNNIEIYYNNTTGVMDLKGISNDRISLHKGMLQAIKTIVDFASLNAYDDCFHYIRETYKKFCSKELPTEYYREFNPLSEFLLDSRKSIIGYSFQYAYLPDKYKKYINISVNEKFFRELSLACVALFFKSNPHRL